MGIVALIQQVPVRVPQPQTPPDATTILATVMLGVGIVFVLSVITTGLVAKKINNISEPSYSKAFGATFFKNILFWPGFMMGLYVTQMNPIIVFAAAATLIPLVIYKIVFGSMWREAAVIWLVVSIQESALLYGLTLAGIMSFQAFI